MKKYEFIFDTEKQVVIDKLMSGVVKPKFYNFFNAFEEDVIYGKASKNRINLYHGTPLKNSFRPVFSAKIVEEEKTKIIGKWRLPVFVILFSIVWYLFLILMSLVPFVLKGEGNLMLLYAVVLAFALFLPALATFACWMERKRMQKVIEYIKKVQNEEI